MTQKLENEIVKDMMADEQTAFDNERASEISKSSEYKLQKVKQIRLQKLIETDFYALGDVTMSDAMKTYRQNLRDIPANHVDEEAYDALLARDSERNLTHSIWDKP
jgi:hypothetical protein